MRNAEREEVQMTTGQRSLQEAGIALLLVLLVRDGPLDSEQLPKLAWLRDGIVASSDMEALTFVLRRGGAREDAVQEWYAHRGEEAVRKLKAAGVNFAITNLHKGAGLQAENEDIKSARAFTALAHKYGIRVAGYVGSS